MADCVVEPAPSMPSMTIRAPGWRFGGFIGHSTIRIFLMTGIGGDPWAITDSR